MHFTWHELKKKKKESLYSRNCNSEKTSLQNVTWLCIERICSSVCAVVSSALFSHSVKNAYSHMLEGFSAKTGYVSWKGNYIWKWPLQNEVMFHSTELISDLAFLKNCTTISFRRPYHATKPRRLFWTASHLTMAGLPLAPLSSIAD